jgi:hypothetical protein
MKGGNAKPFELNVRLTLDLENEKWVRALHLDLQCILTNPLPERNTAPRRALADARVLLVVRCIFAERASPLPVRAPHSEGCQGEEQRGRAQ